MLLPEGGRGREREREREREKAVVQFRFGSRTHYEPFTEVGSISSKYTLIKKEKVFNAKCSQ